MTRSPRLGLALHALLLGSLALGSAGCPVDSRELEPTDGQGGRRATGGASNAGAQNRGGTSSDAGQTSLTGGEDGSGGEMGGGAPGSGGALQSGGAPGSDAGSSGEGGGGFIDGCPDLDGNRVADCSETLAKNASFAENGAGWKAEPDVVVTWKSKQTEQSGLLSVKNTRVADFVGLSLGSSLQCVRAQPNFSYTIYARVYIPDKQGSGQGGAGLLFYDSVDCSGNPTYGFTTTLFSEIGRWLTTDGFGQAPETTRSMAIRLVSVKPFNQNWFDVWFDDVLVRRY